MHGFYENFAEYLIKLEARSYYNDEDIDDDGDQKYFATLNIHESAGVLIFLIFAFIKPIFVFAIEILVFYYNRRRNRRVAQR